MRNPLGAITTFVWPTLIQIVFAFKSLEIKEKPERQHALTVPLMTVGGILTLLKSQLP